MAAKSLHHMLIVLTFLLEVGQGFPVEAHEEAHPTVVLSSATIVGTQQAPPAGGPIANKFLGIPYAKLPIRFAAPEPAASLKGTYDATKWKPSCIQQSTTAIGTKFPNQAETLDTSEDCLYLNIFTATWANSSSGLPVMFWIHGGNLQYGSPALDIYDGNAFASNESVVLVSIAYRLSVFGFVKSPELNPLQRNPGFLDQRLALQWVQKNIKAFEGDASKVTIFGESAGGWSVKNLLTVPPMPLPFRAAIMESQGTLLPVDGWNALVAALGCTDGLSQLACVRSVDAKTSMDTSLALSLFFQITPDGVTARDHHENAFVDGTAARVTFVIGNNGLEGSIIPRPDLSSLNNLTAKLFGNSVIIDNLINGLLDQGDNGMDTSVDAAERVLSDLVMTCATKLLSEYAVDHGYTAYRYLYNATFPNTSSFKGQGAFHTAEIPEVFGTYPIDKATAQEAQLSTFMQSRWANFAKSPGKGPGWPKAKSTPKFDELLGNAGSSTEVVIDPSQDVDKLCAILDPILLLSGYV